MLSLWQHRPHSRLQRLSQVRGSLAYFAAVMGGGHHPGSAETWWNFWEGSHVPLGFNERKNFFYSYPNPRLLIWQHRALGPILPDYSKVSPPGGLWWRGGQSCPNHKTPPQNRPPHPFKWGHQPGHTTKWPGRVLYLSVDPSGCALSPVISGTEYFANPGRLSGSARTGVSLLGSIAGLFSLLHQKEADGSAQWGCRLAPSHPLGMERSRVTLHTPCCSV